MHSKATELYLRLNERIIERYETTGVAPGCRARPELFFPEDYFDGAERSSVEAWARKLCGECPVQSLCAEYGLTAKETTGVWGGLTARDRADILRRR